MDVLDKQHVVAVAAAAAAEEGHSSGPMCAALCLYLSSKEKWFSLAEICSVLLTGKRANWLTVSLMMIFCDDALGAKAVTINAINRPV